MILSVIYQSKHLSYMDKLNDALLQDTKNYRLAKHWWLSSTVTGLCWIGVTVVNEGLSLAEVESR